METLKNRFIFLLKNSSSLAASSTKKLEVEIRKTQIIATPSIW